MAGKANIGFSDQGKTSRKMKTSIGASANTNPKNKNKRRNHKKYRGQGR